jgi:hypothetical protein
MKKKLFIAVIISFFSILTKAQVKMDTTSIISKADKEASMELKKYDESSGRETGVPLALEHYNKLINYNQDKTKVYVTYVFDKIKLYGEKTANSLKIKDEDKFPFHFGVMIDLATEKVTVFK